MRRIADKVLDESFNSSLGGASRDFAESSSNTAFAFFLALGLIYLVLAAQFESFIDPFIIMITVPLSLGWSCIKFEIIRANPQYIFADRHNYADRVGDQEWNFNC